jgi:hypothetical protein
MEFNPLISRIKRIYQFEDDVCKEMKDDFLVTLSQHSDPSDRLSIASDYLGFSDNFICLVWLALNNCINLLTES